MNIKKVTITKVYKNENKQDGTPYQYNKDSKYHKAGDRFTRIGIKFEGDDNTYYTNADAKSKAMSIEEGQSILLNFEEQVDGSQVWRNFNFPTKEQLVEFANNI